MIFFWKSHAYLAVGAVYDEYIGPNGARVWDVKELTLLGYFTSEIGMTKAQRYTESPGRYDPCIPYKPGETTFAGHA